MGTAGQLNKVAGQLNKVAGTPLRTTYPPVRQHQPITEGIVMTTVEINARTAYVAGLRKLADALEADPAMELPFFGTTSGLGQYCHDRESMAAWVALLDDAKEGSDGEWHEVSGRIKGIGISVRIQGKYVGRTVTREVEIFEVEPFLPAQS